MGQLQLTSAVLTYTVDRVLRGPVFSFVKNEPFSVLFLKTGPLFTVFCHFTPL